MTMKVKSINDTYFGKDPTKRYLVRSIRKAAENLVATELSLRFYDEIKAKHTCPNNERVVASCAYCDNYNILLDAYLDAAYLSARLIFSKGHKALAGDFITDILALDKCCIEQYYFDKYDYEFTDNGELKELHELANSVAKVIKTKYKTIENYQTYKFHQPTDQVVADTATKVQNFGGYKLNVTEKKSKQTSNTKDLLDMLVSLSGLIDRYSHLVSLPNIQWQIPIKRTVEATKLLFSIDVDKEKEEKIIAETEKFIEPINKMLNCGTGLKNHNALQFQKIKKALDK